MQDRIVSIGKIEEVCIPDDLPYAKALHVLVQDAVGTGVTIDLGTFFSESAIELHNFVASIRYRFVTIGSEPLLVYEVRDRPNCVYRELRYDGSVLETSAWDAEFGAFSSTQKELAQIARRKSMLG